MKKPSVYKDYPEVPYINENRDIDAWEQTPEKFPYAVVERRQMQRLEEGILPGHLILLWRIQFNTFTNESVFPQYFEYRYGIDAPKELAFLIDHEFVEVCSPSDTVELLSAPILKRLLKENGLPVSGKKQDLVKRVLDNFNDYELSSMITLIRYRCTEKGMLALANHPDIIERHGPKSY